MKYTSLLPLLITVVTTLFPAMCWGAVVNHEIPPRKNDGFKQAIFRLWLPDEPGAVRGIIVESGNGGKPFYEDPEWQEFARKHQLAMLTHFVNGDIPTNKEGYEHGPIYEPPFTQALQALAATSKHPEIATAPLLTFGACHATLGGFFPWRKTASPRMGQRVVAFAATDWMQLGAGQAKEAVPAGYRDIPGLFIVRSNIEAQYASIAKNIFAINRKRGAPWCLAVAEANTAKIGPLLRAFFEPVLVQRVPPAGKTTSPSVQLKAVDEGKGWLGNLQSKEVTPSISFTGQRGEAVWLPDEASAKAWQAYISAK